jgi:hypothetical protein
MEMSIWVKKLVAKLPFEVQPTYRVGKGLGHLSGGGRVAYHDDLVLKGSCCAALRVSKGTRSYSGAIYEDEDIDKVPYFASDVSPNWTYFKNVLNMPNSNS